MRTGNLGRGAYLLFFERLRPLGILTIVVIVVNSLMLKGQPDAWFDLIGASLLIVTVAVAAIFAADLVGKDFRSGAVQLWLQKPVSPSQYYLARLGEAIICGCIVVAIIVLVARLGVWWAGWEPPTEILTGLPRLLLTVLIVSGIGFGVSAWTARGSALITLAVFTTGLVIERDLPIRGDIYGPVLTPIVRALLFPESALRTVQGFAMGEESDVGSALARIFAYASAWVLVGIIGVGRAVGRGGVTRARGN